MLLFNFCLFHFSIFQMTIVKNVMEKPFFFIIDIVDFYETLLRRKYFRSTYFWQWDNGSLKVFWNFHGNAFCFFISSKWRGYYNLEISRCSRLQNINMSKLAILKWKNIRQNLKKGPLLFRSEIGIFDIFFKRLHEVNFEDLQLNSNWKFQTRATMFHNMAPL